MEVKLSKWQTEVWDDPARIKVINVGRRSGKSTLAVLRIIDFALKHKGSISWIVSPTYRQTKQICLELFREYLPKGAVSKINETDLIIKLENAASIHLKGADIPDSLRGVHIDFIVFDETAFIDRWQEVWNVLRPTLVDSKADCWFISTPNGYNHFWDLYNNKDYKNFHYTSYDNPFIDRDELERVKQEMTEDAFAQEFLAEFRKMSGLIYKDFRRDIHMVDIPYMDSNWTFSRALDFGYAHKTALIYFAVNSTGDTIYAYDGLYQTGLTTGDIAGAVQIKDSGKVITNPVADSAQPMLIEELKRLGVHFNPVEKGADSVKNGIVKVAELLKIRQDTGKPTLMFNKDLHWIAEEFESYHWIENRAAGNAIKEVPYKMMDDAMDCIRYYATSYKRSEEDIIDPNSFNMPEDEVW